MVSHASGSPLVVVVDDDETTLMVLRAALRGAGYRVQTRSSGLGTSAQLLRDPPAAVVLDVDMPGITGDALAEMVRSHRKLQDVRIVLHSGKPEDELEVMASQCGAHAIVPKTGRPREVVARLDQLLGRGTRA